MGKGVNSLFWFVKGQLSQNKGFTVCGSLERGWGELASSLPTGEQFIPTGAPARGWAALSTAGNPTPCPLLCVYAMHPGLHWLSRWFECYFGVRGPFPVST